jgi:hypothetical protein
MGRRWLWGQGVQAGQPGKGRVQDGCVQAGEQAHGGPLLGLCTDAG